MILRNTKTIILITLFLLQTANVYAQKDLDDKKYSYNYASLNNRCQVYDPYESVNRKIFVFNAILDGFILRPIAKGYGAITNDYTKDRVESFLDNVREPLSTVNYALQGNPSGMFKTFWRFTVNSTLGLVGLFDIASKFDIKAEPQTFGSTLASYGMGAGPYLVIPFYGSASARDFMDVVVLNSALNPVDYFTHEDFKNIVTATRTIHFRERRIPFTDYISKNSPDPYIAIRNAIYNEREGKMLYPEDYICHVN